MTDTKITLEALQLLETGLKESKILLCLDEIEPKTTRDIELQTGLRQPEVSLAIKNLLVCAWVNPGMIKTITKGGPQKTYILNKPLDEIVKNIIEQRNKAQYDEKKKIELMLKGE